MPFLVHRKFI
ncbi:hypothetical protein SPV_2520 [Streptococcus pneumoniae]|nr:hypothetical protein SPV_2520 [Streptococcus pneumoniae]